MLITSYHKCSGFKRPKFIILEVRSLKWAKIKVSVELRSFLEALGASLFPSCSCSWTGWWPRLCFTQWGGVGRGCQSSSCRIPLTLPVRPPLSLTKTLCYPGPLPTIQDKLPAQGPLMNNLNSLSVMEPHMFSGSQDQDVDIFGCRLVLVCYHSM